VIPNREFLIDRVISAKKQFSKIEVNRPENWGGYCVNPKSIEFWQGGSARLHDRIRYTLKNEVWVIERLAP
jgi:pyridoxamine 5'-phosphate oxidase